MSDLTARDIRVLRTLSEQTDWVPRRALKVGAARLQDLYFRGLVAGAGAPDARGFGNTPDTSVWRITEQGIAALTRPRAKP